MDQILGSTPTHSGRIHRGVGKCRLIPRVLLRVREDASGAPRGARITAERGDHGVTPGGVVARPPCRADQQPVLNSSIRPANRSIHTRSDSPGKIPWQPDTRTRGARTAPSVDWCPVRHHAVELLIRKSRSEGCRPGPPPSLTTIRMRTTACGTVTMSAGNGPGATNSSMDNR